MRALHALERRMQDLERKFQNKERLGKIVAVKYEKDRWYVKLNDGQDQQASGSDSQATDTFKSDWQPWKSFSHGTIKMSVPPKVGQHALLRSVGGMAELATVEPFHYGPETPSPHGKEDEIVKLIEDEDEDDKKQGGQGGQGGGAGGEGSGGQNGQQQDKWNHWKRQTKDTHHLIIQKKKKDDQGGQQQDSQQQQSGSGGSGGGLYGEAPQAKKKKAPKLPEVGDDGEDDTVQVKATKDMVLKTVGKKKAKVKMTKDMVNVRFGDKKGDITLTDNDVTIKFADKTSWKMSDQKLEIGIGDTKWTLDSNGWKQEGGKVNHNEKNIGSTHKHLGVQPGGGQTDIPIPMS